MIGLSEPFWLHEATRRRVCLALFVLGCILPTVGMLLWVGWRMTPWYLAQQASEAERLLGLVVRLEGLSEPRPAEAIYQGVQLADPDSGQPILRADQVQIRWLPPHAANRACVGRVEMGFQGLEIYTEGLPRLVELVRRALGQPAHWPRYEVHLHASEARLRIGQQIRNLSECTGFLQPLDGGCQGSVSFRLAGSPVNQPIQIRFGRDHRQSPPLSGLELALGESAIPCGVLVGVLPGLARLGPLASMQGTLWICQQQGQVEYRFQGHLFQVDWRTLLGEESNRLLTGLAQIDVEDARLVDNRLEEAVMRIRGGPGTLSRRFWQSAVQELGLSSGLQPGPDEETFSYEQLGAAVRIGPEGLLLRGICPVPAPGSIVVSSHQLLLGEAEPAGGPIPLAALVRVLAGSPPQVRTLHVPATRQAAELLGLLPLPSETDAPAFPPETDTAGRAVGLAETASRPGVQ